MFEVDVSTLHRSSRGTVTGAICIQSSRGPFPETGWSDLVVGMLAWWLRALDQLPLTGQVDLHFMDGPFLATLIDTGNGSCTMQCVHAGEERTVVAKDVVKLATIRREVMAAARVVCDECLRRGWLTDDLATLQERLALQPEV